MRILRKLLLLGIVLYVLRIGLGLGIAWWHYSNTEDYSSFLKTHPVSDEIFTAANHFPDPLHVGKQWLKGETDPRTWDKDSNFTNIYSELSIKLMHGEDLMLDFKQSLEHALTLNPWQYLGFHYSTPVLETGDNLRAVVLIWLDGTESSFAVDAIDSGKVVTDIFLISGEGDSEIRYLDLAERENTYTAMGSSLPLNPNGLPVWKGDRLPGFPLWRTLSGIITNLKDLPEEGIIHYFSTHNTLPYVNSGTIGPHSIGRMHFSNTDEYSYSYEINRLGGGSGSQLSDSTKWSQMQEWNGDVW